MGSDTSKLKHSASMRDGVPSIKLPSSATFYEGMYRKCQNDVSRSRNGSASSRTSQNRHPISLKMRRLIQSCFANPHEFVGKKIMKRAADQKSEFAHFYLSLDPEMREELDDSVKSVLKRVVAAIDNVDEIQRLSAEFGQQFAELRAHGFKPDFFAVIADATCKECTRLDSAVHKEHTTTHAFSQFGGLVFSSVRDGYYEEVRRMRRASNSFSTGSNGSQRRKKPSLDSGDVSRNASPRTSVSRNGSSPRSTSPVSQNSDDGVDVDAGGFLRPPAKALRSY